MNKIIIPFYILMAVGAHAEGEMDGWYNSNSGLYLVQEVIYGKYYGQIAYSKSNQLRFYIVNPNDPDCVKSIGNDIVKHEPLYVNKKLVRISQYCDGNLHYFYPSTDEGNTYVIREFNKSDSVEFKMYDESKRFLFSAKNFKNIYSQLLGKSGGI